MHGMQTPQSEWTDVWPVATKNQETQIERPLWYWCSILYVYVQTNTLLEASFSHLFRPISCMKKLVRAIIFAIN